MEETAETIWSHVSSLRKTLLRVFAIIVAGALICFLFYDSLLNFLTSPLNNREAMQIFTEQKIEFFQIKNRSLQQQHYSLPVDAIVKDVFSVQQTSPGEFLIAPGGILTYEKAISNGPSLVVLGPLEGMLIAIKVCLLVGCAVTSPLWMFAVLSFVLPGLRKHEKELVGPFFILSILFISCGLLFAFFITIPLANNYLIEFNKPLGMNLWSLSNYLSYTVFLLIANAIGFELAVIGIFLVRLKILSSRQLISMRRHAIVAAFILGALLTPPDVLTQFLLAIPLIALYEGLVVYARFRQG